MKTAWIILNDNYNQDDIDEVWIDKNKALKSIESLNNDKYKKWYIKKIYIMDLEENNNANL